MPLVRIDVSRDLSDERVAALADAVHLALVDTVGVPKDDRFQIISKHDGNLLLIDREFPGVNRSNEALIIEITFREGRSQDQKQRLYAEIVERAAQTAGLRPADIMVVLHENTFSDWSFGDGKAQYVEN